jgi:hypothetical protein
MTKIQRGAVLRTAGAYDSLTIWTIAVAFPAVPIYQEQLACLEVLAQNDPSSASNVLIGNEFGQSIVLVPGASITIPINNVNRVWAGTAPGGSATINWIAMT